jgi:hypothetical protein
MAMCVRFICQHCAKSVDSWDEGNPYYFDDTGTKRYAYHPDPQRDFLHWSRVTALVLELWRGRNGRFRRSDDNLSGLPFTQYRRHI